MRESDPMMAAAMAIVAIFTTVILIIGAIILSSTRARGEHVSIYELASTAPSVSVVRHGHDYRLYRRIPPHKQDAWAHPQEPIKYVVEWPPVEKPEHRRIRDILEPIIHGPVQATASASGMWSAREIWKVTSAGIGAAILLLIIGMIAMHRAWIGKSI